MVKAVLTDLDLNNNDILNSNLSGGGSTTGARVTKSGNQTLPNNMSTVLTFDQEDYDTENYHDNVTNNSRLTIPDDGFYVVTGNVEWTTNTTGNRSLTLRVNGSTIIGNIKHAPPNTDPRYSLTTSYEFSAGDYVELLAAQTSGGNLDVEATVTTSFSIVKVPGGSGGSGGGGTTTGVSAVSTTIQTLADDVQTILDISDNIEYDTENYFDAGSPTKVTIPEDGFYIISAQVNFAPNATGFRFIQFYLNGSPSLALHQHPVSDGTELTIINLDTTYQFTAGDEIQISARQNSGGNLDVSFARLRVAKISGGGSGGGASTLLLGLGAWWKLDEVSGDRGDSSGNGWTLFDNNTVTSQAGLIGNEAVFEFANSEYLGRGTSDEGHIFQQDQSFSISGWVTFDALTETFYVPFAVFGGTGNNRKWQLFYQQSSGFLNFGTSKDGLASDNITGTTTILTSQRYHVVLTYDAETNSKVMYLDNSVEASGTASHAAGLFNTSAENITLGCQSTQSPALFLDGKLDEVAYWSRALTAAEVSELYNSGSGITLEDLASGSGSGGGSSTTGARATKTGNQTIPDASTTTLTFDSEDYDTENYHDNVTNNSRLTVPEDGFYIVTGNCEWAANATGRRLLIIRLNGASGPYSIQQNVGADVLRHQIVSTFQLTAGDYLELDVFQNSGGNLDVLSANTKFDILKVPGGSGSGGRERLTADRTYYVATTGSDSNDGLTVGNPFLTIQKALDVVAELDIGIYNVTVQLADGTYSPAATLSPQSPVGSGLYRIQGNTGDQSLVIIDGGSHSGSIFQTTLFDNNFRIEYLTLQNSGNDFVVASGTANNFITVNNINIQGTMGAGRRIFYSVTDNCGIRIRGTINVSGGSLGTPRSCLEALSIAAFIDADSSTINITGSPTFSQAFADAERFGRISLEGITVTGTFTGTGIQAIEGAGVLLKTGTVPNGTSTATGGLIV